MSIISAASILLDEWPLTPSSPEDDRTDTSQMLVTFQERNQLPKAILVELDVIIKNKDELEGFLLGKGCPLVARPGKSGILLQLNDPAFGAESLRLGHRVVF